MRAALASLALIVAAGAAGAQQHLPTVPELLTAELKAAQDALQAGGVFLADPSMLRDEGPLSPRAALDVLDAAPEVDDSQTSDAGAMLAMPEDMFAKIRRFGRQAA